MVNQPLSSLDSSFLSLEGATTPMHLGAVLVFAPADATAGDAQRLATTLRERAARIPRLRRRLVRAGSGLGAAAWDTDRDFDPAAHVHHGELTGPGGQTALAERAAALMAVPLDRDRPLWELHVLGGLGGGRVAVVAKVHHALADGLRAVELGFRLFDDLCDLAEPENPTPSRPTAARTGLVHLLDPIARLVNARTAPAELTHRAGQANETARIGAAVLRSLLRPAPSSSFNVPVGPRRTLALRQLDLDDLYRVRKQHGGTINDVVLAVVAGALRGWLSRRAELPDRPLRVLVPVSRPQRATDRPAGNHLSGYLVDLPSDEPDPLARLHAIRQTMEENKAAGPARGPGAFPVLVNHLPPLLHRLTAPLTTPLAGPVATRLFNTVLTNVPLPDIPLTMAGARLVEIYPVVPLGPGQALGLAVSRYRRTLHIGLHADPAAVPDLDQLADELPAALTELQTMAAS